MEKIKIGIFIKLFLSFFFISLISALASYFLTGATYKKLIEGEVFRKYLPRGEVEIEREIFLLSQKLSFKASLLLLGILLATFFICFFLSKKFTSPIKELLKGARKVKEGDLEVKIKKVSEDEIGELVEEFNQMVKELKRSKSQLEEAKHSLEIKVRARTRQLQELAQTLEEKVKIRTKRLQEKIEELERFQKFAVGRELKMKELKEEIQKLKERLKKYERESG